MQAKLNYFNSKSFGWRGAPIIGVLLLAMIFFWEFTSRCDADSTRSSLHVPRVHAKENAHYAEVRRRVLLGCGALCDHTVVGEPGPFFNFVSKAVDCHALFNNTDSDAPAVHWPPPEGIPDVMLDDFTMGNKIKIDYRYDMVRYSGAQAMENVWTKDFVNDQVAKAQSGTLEGTYGLTETNHVIQTIREACVKHNQCVKGLHVMVIGSERPWLEAVLLAEGAARITTLEYGSITSHHPQVQTMLPSELRQKFLAGTFERFDAIATFSSVEHSGLGRYGDTLNPWGDIQAIAKAWCVAKEHAPMLIGVMPGLPHDNLTWNLHRQYGKLRWTQMMANWEQISRGYGGEQDIHVFRRRDVV